MAGVSQRPGDISGHPDVYEMRERYDRMVGGRSVVAVEGLTFLAGLYCAISPWVVHFSDGRPDLLLNNLVLGIAVALVAIGFTVVPDRMFGLSAAVSAIGVWLIVAPWIVERGPDAGMVLNNVILGTVICVLGLACGAALMRGGRETT